MKLSVTLCLLILWMNHVVNAQEFTTEEEKIDHWMSESENAFDSANFERAWIFIDSAKLHATRLDYQNGLARIYVKVGMFYYNGMEANMDSAIYYTKKAYDIAVKENYEFIILNSLNQLSSIYHQDGAYAISLDLAFELSDRLKTTEIDSLNITILSAADNLIVNIYLTLGDYPKALKYLKDQTSKEYAKEDVLGAILINMAYTNNKLKDFENAYVQALEGLELTSEFSTYPYDTIGALYVAGEAAHYLGLKDQSRNLLGRSLKGSQALADSYYIVFTLNLLAEIALIAEDYELAKSYFFESIEKSEISRLRAERVNTYLGLHKIYLALEQPYKSLDYHVKYTNLKDSLFNETKSYQLTELDTKYKTTQNQREIEQKSAQLKQQEIQRNALLAGLAMLVVMVVIIYRSQRLKTKSNRELAIKNKQIQEIEELKARWFANVAHELKTPLTLIDGPLTKVLEKEHINEVVKKDLELVKRNARRLSDMIFEILEISKIEDNKLELKIESTDLSILVKSVVSSFYSAAQVERIKLITEIDKSFIMSIDENKVFKVLINLVSNAFKFTPSGGEIKVRLSQNKNSIVVLVKDSGEGISPEDQQYIFDRFFQSNNPAKARQGGTGIGLSIAKEIALLHDGELTVQSELGIGSEFRFIIPLERLIEALDFQEVLDEATIEKPLPIILDATDKPLLLLVEDNADMRSYICSFMKYDYKITEAKDGIEALELLEHTSPDLIISDLMMPRMDGIELAKKVKSNKDWQNIPFITLTAMASEEHRLQALRIGVEDYLSKPFIQDELIARSENLLKNANQRKTVLDDKDIQGYDDQLVKKLYLEVSENISSSLLTVTFLAEKASMSDRQLQRYLKKVTGFSPNQFIREIKLQKALELLEKKVYPTVAEVRHAIGFERASHFAELFENRFGKKPNQY